MSKYDAIFLDLCKSPEMVFCSYLFRILDTQGTAFLLSFGYTCVVTCYCEQNKIASKQFIKKFHQFTGDKYNIAVKWLMKKVKSLCPLKDCNLHPSIYIYKDVCSCGETYIGETIHNVEEHWSEHNSADNKWEPDV